jgi:hypothetical protein
MAKRFGAQHARDGYAAMGGAMARPIYKSTGGRDIKAAIEAERRKAARAAKIKKS